MTTAADKLIKDADIEIKSFGRRDKLLGYERAAQKEWEVAKAFEASAGKEGDPKFLVTFPYPYMNGVLHVGHAFSLTKAEFSAQFQRLQGKNVLFPFGFHCTGMPIAAAAKNLRMEMEKYGTPPAFPIEETIAEEDAGGIKKKGKASGKKSTKKYQWQIMQEMGVPEDEIASFADPNTWLTYFPPIAQDHLRQFGLSADWRRSFITTAINPYYDAFIRWQFHTLKKLGLIAFGKRISIFSPLNNQACADHDRSKGEGVGPQEYVGIKMKLLGPFPESMKTLEGKPVFLLAATLRPETMYGQTNCWALPRGEYGAYAMTNGDIFVCSHRAALNMSYQDLSAVPGKPEKLCDVSGWDLIGRAVQSPNAKYERMYVLPLLTISMEKGTGIVTSVPSDAPDDYAALTDLQKSSEMKTKYKLEDHQVDPFEVVPIISIPEWGEAAAVKACKEMGVKNQHDRAKLDLAKKEVYKLGFARGTMIMGEYAGRPVNEAKPLIQAELVARGDAVVYSEPDGVVVSRTGDECVCAALDQWYLKYGQNDWKNKVEKHIEETLETYNPMAKEKFRYTVGWLKEWACSRTFGLGTHLPWDTQYVIESLSDSTVYMAYYTIAHLLQQGSLEGSSPGPAQIPSEQLTTQVFDYILLSGPRPDTSIPLETLDRLRGEFEYWYPVDLRVSGKDLIGNHLTMSLYNHAALWKDPAKWPRSFFTNGHSLLNDKKMSKSEGNFMTLIEAIETFGADATRLALADAGDGLEDGNFTIKTCNSAVLRLTKEAEWISETLASIDLLRDGPTDDFMDRMFLNDINVAVNTSKTHYETMMFRRALKSAVYDLQNDRNYYRASCANGMHRDVVLRYMEASILLIAPICPHWAQAMWKQIGKEGLLCHACWPAAEEQQVELTEIGAYLKDLGHAIRLAHLSSTSAGKKKKQDKPAPNALSIFVAPVFPDWQKTVLATLQEYYDEHHDVPAKQDVTQLLRSKASFDKKKFGAAMAFANGSIKSFEEKGVSAFRTALPFNESELLKQHLHVVTRNLDGINTVTVQDALDTSAPGYHAKVASSAVPGSPSFSFFNE